MNLMPISKVHSSFGGNNKGSSTSIASYLDKENKELDKLANNTNSREEAISYREKQQSFFSDEEDRISNIQAIDDIDKNKKKLGKIDDKFYAPTISFSQKELQHLSSLASSGRAIKSIDEMTNKEFKKYNHLLRAYARKAMDNYAANFNRQDKGLTSGKDLVYYAKIEHQRTHRGTDREVLNGIARAGEKKKGLQSHIHIIVSRKDKTQRLKLNPTTNEKNTVRKIGNNEYRVGFDRKNWINENEKTFDKQFNYNRGLSEKFEVQNKLLNGNTEERFELNKLVEKEKVNEQTKSLGI